MGGYAYIIPGELAPARRPDLHPPAPAQPVSLWRRLLGGGSPSTDGARVTEMPNGDRFFDIPPGHLRDVLIADLRAWINARLPQPSTGTAHVLQYIGEIEPTVYVRGLQRRAEQTPEFYVQITFSGCAGQSETSARAAAHWTSLWYTADRERIASAHLTPFGFTPSTNERGEEEEMMFLPAGELGYLEYCEDGLLEPDQPAFEIDASVMEAPEDHAAIERLDAAFGRYMSDRRCRCQVCEPGFGDAAPEV